MLLKKSIGLFIVLVSLSVAAMAQQPGVPLKPGESRSSNTTRGTNDASTTADAYKTIAYINSLFSLYNEYNTKLSIDERRGELVFSDKFLELRGDYGSVEFRRSGELMGLYCKSDGTCLRVSDVDTGETEENKVKYTFGLKENDVAIPEMDRAIRKLNSMLADLDTGSGSGSNGGLSAIARKNLKIINDAFDTYNGYETVFSVQGKNLHWDSTVANVYAQLNELTFYIDYENQWMVMRCTSDDCIEGSVSQGSYSMGLSDSNGIAPNIEEVLRAFNDLRREILTN